MKVVFMGTPDFAVPSLRRLIEAGYDVHAVISQPDRPKGRKKILTPPPVKLEAEKHHLPVWQPQQLKHSEELSAIIELGPDLIITAAYGQILPTELLIVPTYGCINVHASLLPKYRGGAPIHHAIMDGQQETGITIMYMAKALDAGDIITQARVPIENDDNVGTMHDKLSIVGADLLLETIPLLQKDGIKARAQDEQEVTYAPTIKREDEVIVWQRNNIDIHNHIRGLCPFPGAYTSLKGEGIKIWEAKLLPDTHVTATPGTVYRFEDDGICVATGDNRGILLTKIQPAGKKKMTVYDFLRGAGQHWTEGLSLGT